MRVRPYDFSFSSCHSCNLSTSVPSGSPFSSFASSFFPFVFPLLQAPVTVNYCVCIKFCFFLRLSMAFIGCVNRFGKCGPWYLLSASFTAHVRLLSALLFFLSASSPLFLPTKHATLHWTSFRRRGSLFKSSIFWRMGLHMYSFSRTCDTNDSHCIPVYCAVMDS
jgi:hypothetical protein